MSFRYKGSWKKVSDRVITHTVNFQHQWQVGITRYILCLMNQHHSTLFKNMSKMFFKPKGQKVSVISIWSEPNSPGHFHFIWIKKSQSLLFYLNQIVTDIFDSSESKSLSHIHFIWIKKSAIFISSESKRLSHFNLIWTK